MAHKQHKNIRKIGMMIAVSAFLAAKGQMALAQVTVPGSVDAGRIDAQQNNTLQAPQENIGTPKQGVLPKTLAPEAAKSITLELKNVAIKDMTAFDQAEIKDIYAPYLGQEITLDKAWDFANEITARYRKEGYFLSRAYIPQQAIDDGIITINVIEGYIGTVDLNSADPDHYLLCMFQKNLLKEKPLKLSTLEKNLLLLSDMPGVEFDAILDQGQQEGQAVTLTLTELPKKGRGTIAFDNSLSRYIGPYSGRAVYTDSFLPYQGTTLSGLASMPNGNKLWAINASHMIKLLPQWDAEIAVSHVSSDPAFTLTQSDIESTSNSWKAALWWRVKRQRLHNVSLGLAFENRNVSTDVLDSAFTRDKISMLRSNLQYNGIGFLDGYDSVSVRFTHGLNGLSDSQEGDLTLSRAQAKPDFAKIEATWQHIHTITPDLRGISLVKGQLSSQPLFSSEEMGIGGAEIGKGYDQSEITGDHGLAVSLQLEYTSLPKWNGFNITPSAFYDVGKVWNRDTTGQPSGISLSSAGFGIQAQNANGVSMKATFAQPLTLSAGTPLYGANGGSPRIRAQMGWSF